MIILSFSAVVGVFLTGAALGALGALVTVAKARKK